MYRAMGERIHGNQTRSKTSFEIIYLFLVDSTVRISIYIPKIFSTYTFNVHENSTDTRQLRKTAGAWNINVTIENNVRNRSNIGLTVPIKLV